MPIHSNPWFLGGISLIRNSKQVLHITKTIYQHQESRNRQRVENSYCQANRWADVHPNITVNFTDMCVKTHTTTNFLWLWYTNFTNDWMILWQVSPSGQKQGSDIQEQSIVCTGVFCHHHNCYRPNLRAVNGWWHQRINHSMQLDLDPNSYLHSWQLLTCRIWMACFRAWLFSGTRGSCRIQDTSSTSAVVTVRPKE